MKNWKIGIIALCGLVLTFSACKKDKDSTPTPNNSFIIGNNSYATTGAFVFEDDNYEGLQLTNANLVGGNANAQNANIVLFDFRVVPLPVAGTYTYKDRAVAGFDASKNFSDVYCLYGTTLSGGQATGGTQYTSETFDATGSSITISKTGDTYTFTYNLKFTNKANNQVTNVSGQFKGTVTTI